VPRQFAPGDRVLLIDAKQRRHLITLAEGGAFHSHTGVLDHALLIGEDEGTTVRTTMGSRMVAVRPTLSEYILKMPRGAQVIYPKDLGPILMLADVFPGARVLESGVGSGALTMTLLRAIGPEGHVLGYELRDDFADRARRNVESFLGPDLPLTIEVRDVYDGIDADDLDRVILDLPEPWRVVKHAEAALRPGGILLSYLPTIGQVMRLREELADSAFGMAESLEVLQRSWHVDGQSVRPDHRMVAHTGFLTHARLLAPAQ
jgi:tRNA (adenine57-N1/adenine58-N1)-methyltransferase catalytic subunit